MAPIHVCISGSYGGMNLGDEAILQSIVRQLRADVPVEITVFTRDGEDTQRRHGVERIVQPRDTTRERMRAEIDQCDLFILGGGGLLYDRDAERYLRDVMAAQQAGVATMTYAISAGPLNDPNARRIVRRALNGCALLTVRDRLAQKLLEDIGIEREVIVTADPALLIEPEAVDAEMLEREGLAFQRRLVAMSVREPGPAAPELDPDHYHSLLANAADYIVDRFDADVVFLPLERLRQDLQHSHAVIAKMRRADRATVLKGDYTPGQLIDLMTRFDFAVGMRLHVLIFAAIAGVPFVALPYASKVRGFLEDLQMDTPPLERVGSGQLIALIDRAWDRREGIRTTIQRAVPELQARARKTHTLMLELLHGRAALPVG